jgi:homoserine dehydrogenase
MTTTSTLQLTAPTITDVRGTRTIRIALAGCGVVGGELARQVGALREEVETRYGIRFEIASVLVRDADRCREVPVARERFTCDRERFLATPADVVVEAMGGTDTALRIARSTLGSGRRLVTANKTLVAMHGGELARLAADAGGRLDFESAVAGGIPVVRAVSDQLHLAGIRRIRGILNGTTNFILGRLEDGDAYADVLREAQAAGYAEADPTRDVEGMDAEDKIRILAWLAFGASPATVEVRRRGILPDPDRLAADARAAGGHPRLVAECARTPAGISASVEPVAALSGSSLAAVRGADNYVEIETERNGTVRLVGPGAGGGPTASAIVGDLIRGARPVRPESATAAGAAPPVTGSWVISVAPERHAEAALERTLGDHALLTVAAPVTLPGVRRVVTAAPGDRVDGALGDLEAQGLQPVASRIES